MIVNSHNEWDKLHSVVVGDATGARFPINDPIFSMQAITTTWDETPLPQGTFPSQVIMQARSDLTTLTSVLQGLDVTVHKPQSLAHDTEIATYDWDVDGMYNYCPRDLLLVIGNKVIECPMVYRSRQAEVRAYESIKRRAMTKGVVWIAAPRPTLFEDEIRVENGKTVLTEEYPIFDAANVCRLGKDILYLVSSTGNYIGAEWLQGVLGNEYRVHVVDNLYSYAHIDSTVVPLAEGRVLLNGDRVNEDNYPNVFSEWERIYVHTDEIVKQYFHEYPYASKWIAMNMLVLEPGIVIMEEGQPYLQAKLEALDIQCIPVPMRMARTLGGGVHCCTLDLHRG